MSRETDWMVFEKAVEVTASAVRGTAGGSQPASYVGDVFREIHKALKEDGGCHASEGVESRVSKRTPPPSAKRGHVPHGDDAHHEISVHDRHMAEATA